MGKNKAEAVGSSGHMQESANVWIDSIVNEFANEGGRQAIILTCNAAAELPPGPLPLGR